MEHNEALLELYLLCFPQDTRADAVFLFDTVFSRAQCVSEWENGRPLAMLFLMDCPLQCGQSSLPFYYLYAACTHPDYRGRGIMHTLLERAKETALQQGKGGIFLKPANRPLFVFYASAGFDPFFKATVITGSGEGLAPLALPKSDWRLLDRAGWHALRQPLLQRFSSCYADMPKPLLDAAISTCRIAESTAGAFAVFEVTGDTLLIREGLFTADVNSLLALAGALLKESGAARLELRLPVCPLPLLPDGLDGETQNFSVLWANDPDALKKYSTASAYHGYALD